MFIPTDNTPTSWSILVVCLSTRFLDLNLSVGPHKSGTESFARFELVFHYSTNEEGAYGMRIRRLHTFTIPIPIPCKRVSISL